MMGPEPMIRIFEMSVRLGMKSLVGCQDSVILSALRNGDTIGRGTTSSHRFSRENALGLHPFHSSISFTKSLNR
jgi:hypothetical protein